MPEAVDREITLRDYGRVLWSGRWLILAATIAAAIVGLVLSVASPTTYTATARVFLGQPTTLSGIPVSTPSTDPATAPEVLRSDALVRQVAEVVEIPPARVRRDVAIDLPSGPGTQNQPSLATITVRDRSRSVAVRLAEAYTQAVLAQVSTDFEGVQQTYRVSVERLGGDIERLEGRVQTYEEGLSRAAAEGDEIRVVAFQSLVESVQQQLATAQTALSDAELQLAQGQQFAPQISDLPGGARSSGSGRNRLRTALFAAVIGLLVGVTVTFVWRGSPARRAAQPSTPGPPGD